MNLFYGAEALLALVGAVWVMYHLGKFLIKVSHEAIDDRVKLSYRFRELTDWCHGNQAKISSEHIKNEEQDRKLVLMDKQITVMLSELGILREQLDLLAHRKRGL